MTTHNSTSLEQQMMLSAVIPYILVMLPLSVYILRSGLLRWKQQRNSPSSAFSHSDVFTYNLALMELVGVSGNFLFFFNQIHCLGYVLSTFPLYAEAVFPVFISVEQYVAVIYPVTYLGLRRGKGLWIRYLSVLFVWLSGGVDVVLILKVNTFQRCLMFVEVSLMAALLAVMIYCSASVLYVLHQPKPGDISKVDRSKQKAFLLLLLITVALVFRFSFNLLYTVLCFIILGPMSFQCIVLSGIQKWVNLFTSLTTPLLYLQRAGKLCC